MLKCFATPAVKRMSKRKISWGRSGEEMVVVGVAGVGVGIGFLGTMLLLLLSLLFLHCQKYFGVLGWCHIVRN